MLPFFEEAGRFGLHFAGEAVRSRTQITKPWREVSERTHLSRLERRSPRFRVTYKAQGGAGGGVVRVEGFDPDPAVRDWKGVEIPAKLEPDLLRLGIGVLADQMKSGLAPTGLDVTTEFAGLVLEPEKLAGGLLAKVMGVFAHAVALHFGVPEPWARLAGKAVEHLFKPVPEPTGARGVAANAVEGFAVVCDVRSGHVTPTVVDFVASHLADGN